MNQSLLQQEDYSEHQPCVVDGMFGQNTGLHSGDELFGQYDQPYFPLLKKHSIEDMFGGDTTHEQNRNTEYMNRNIQTSDRKRKHHQHLSMAATFKGGIFEQSLLAQPPAARMQMSMSYSHANDVGAD